ncbi:uncharacterized protein METZ01_LOCUS195700 [marine metagenome]|uniref:Uncharacterized protein n=1 Tax=marine metagenome TaxID=408172 RepID=A0A382DWH2_9ZZZZ
MVEYPSSEMFGNVLGNFNKLIQTKL